MELCVNVSKSILRDGAKEYKERGVMREEVSVVSYPIFLKCCQHLSDPFWIYLFEDLAYGKCPYGMVIKDECLYSFLKHREFSYALDQVDKTTSDVAQDLCRLLRSTLPLTHKHAIVPDSAHGATWNDIRKKNLKDLLLEQYTLAQKQRFHYSHALTKKLFAVIFIGIQFKTILQRHIHYRNCVIQRIDGIDCRPNQFVCSFNVFLTKPTTPANSYARATSKVSNAWKRYLINL